ncbi:O-antigen ligase family protein [Actinoplanes sp. LDG1-01]|uniref:O-antigen ligase family protein n=1 Tax=Paractinoplanes lichenicola TaxID=2802976 RepID=A0ABS1VQC3_9ACTN|nr:O-antigen ligase family protein [Actinoplanes lichenicola]
MSAAAVTSTDGPAHGVRKKTALPAWPVASILAFYPIWWALGLGVLIFALMAVPMLFLLIRRRTAGRPLRLPPGFAWWAVFLIAVVVSIGALGADPTGTVAGHAEGRLLPAGYKAVMYAALTVLLVYAGNLTEAELPRKRLVKLLGWLFVVTVLGGLLGMVAGNFEFTSPVEWLLPSGVRNKGFVQSLVHPYAAQIMDIVGEGQPRPAAPWGYTNTWGNNFCLLAGWLVVAAWQTRSGKAKFWAVVCLVVSVVPAVVSLNRGLWIGVGVLVLYVAVRYVLAGRLWIIGAVAVAGAVLGVALIATPLGDVVGARLDNGKSNGVRSFLIDRALDGFQDSPVIGYGGTRNTLGGRNSITVGESAGCERCGNFTVGGNGQLWQLLYAHGAVGTAGYLGFFAYGLWRFRRDRSAIGVAAGGAIVTSFSAMLWYNSLVTPLAFMVLAYALLWRNSTEGETT